MKKITVLIACEESQAECMAFRACGCEAYSCDIQPCKPSGHPEWHIIGDVTPFLNGATSFITQDNRRHRVPGWTIIVAHPPCTYLCKVSAVQLKRHGVIDESRLAKLLDARTFFFKCYNAQARYVAVENPLPLAIANLPKPSCFIQPSWYGVKYTKKTLYWLRNLPPLLPEIEHPNPKEYVRASRGKYRSRTFPQVADAMARQWTQYILNDKEPLK